MAKTPEGKRPTAAHAGSDKRVAELERLLECLKGTEGALLECAELAWQFYEGIPIPCQSIDAAGRIVRANSAWLDLLGYSHPEVTGRRLAGFLHAESKPILATVLRRLESHPRVQDVDMKIRKRDGSYLAVRCDGRLVRGDNGRQFRYVHFILRESAGQQSGFEDLHMGQDGLPSVFGSLHDGVDIVSGDHDILYVNPVLERIYGPWAGKKCYQFFRDRTSPCPSCHISTVTGGNTLSVETRCLKNGRTYEIVGTPIRSPNGGVAVLEVARDISARKQAQIALERERKAFQTVAEAAIRAADVTDLCTHVLVGLAEILGFERGVIRLHDKEQGILRVTATTGISPEEVAAGVPDHNLDDKRFVAAHVAATREPVFAPDVRRHRIYRKFHRRFKETGVRSIISWPICSSVDDLLGVVHLVSHTPRDIPATDRAFFEAIAGMCGIAIDRKIAEQALEVSENMYRSRFEDSPLPLWEEDFSDVKEYLEDLKASGTKDFRTYFDEYPDEIAHCADLVRVVEANTAALRLNQVDGLADLQRKMKSRVRRQTGSFFKEALIKVAGGEIEFEMDYTIILGNGDPKHLHLRWAAAPGHERSLAKILVSAVDLTDRNQMEEKRRRDLGAFKIIADAAIRATGVADLCERVLFGLKENLPFDYGAMRLYDEGHRMLRLVATSGLSKAEISKRVPDRPIGDRGYVVPQVARTRRPILAPDVKTDGTLKKHRQRLLGLGIRSMITWPIISTSGDLLGVLHLASYEPKQIREADRVFFETVVGMFAIALERKVAEDSLREERDKANKYLNTARVIFLVLDTDGVVSMVNDRGCELLGKPRAEIVGRNWFDSLVPADIRPAIKTRYAKIAAGEMEISEYYENRILAADGTVRIIAWHDTVLESKKGKIAAILASGEDITSHRRAEEALKESEEMYRSRFENSPIALWEEDFSGVKSHIEDLRASGVRDFRAYFESHPDAVLECGALIQLTDVNRAALELYGTETVKEFERVSAGNIEHRTFKQFRDILVGVADGLTSIEMEYATMATGGQERFIQVRWAAAPGHEEDLSKIQVSVVDLTERKRAEDAMRRAEARLRTYSEDLENMVVERTARIRVLERQRSESEKLAATGRMAARVAHEINNPLAGIKNSFQLLKETMDREHPYYPYAARLEKEIDRIAGIVRRMFDLYSPDETKTVDVSVGETIKGVVAILEKACKASEIDLEVDLPDYPITTSLPKGYLNQILFNLIQNSVEASEPGDVVKVGAYVGQDAVSISVKDWGRGIEAGIAHRIFEPFFTTKESSTCSGLGLGLSVSKGMVEAMGGTLTFESEPPEETVFTVVLPLKTPDPDQGP